MRTARPLKKNGSIDIRLPDQVKTAFMDHCHRNDQTASDAIRTFIDEQLPTSAFQPLQVTVGRPAPLDR